MRDLHIGVLAGGWSEARAVSLQAGDAIAEALRARGFFAERIIVDRDLDLTLRQAQVDVAFVALPDRIQALLELFGIAFTGSDALAHALAENRVKAREIFRLYNLPTPPSYVLPREATDAEAEERHGVFGFPAVVKPVRGGGAALVHETRELLAARGDADEVLVERFIPGTRVSVPVVHDRALGVAQVISTWRGEYRVPARLSPERARGLATQALLAHHALGCAGATRVDLVVSERGNETVLEVTPAPALTPTGLFVRVAGHAGLDFGTLVEEILGGARLGARRTFHERRTAQRPFAGPERRATAERH